MRWVNFRMSKRWALITGKPIGLNWIAATRCAAKSANCMIGARSWVTTTLCPCPLWPRLGGTALIGDGEIKMMENNLPSTFVPGRNLLFLTYGAALAYRRGLGVLVGGMCETDYSGYPDCRRDTLNALEQAINKGMESDISIDTPLMHIDKAATWALAHQLGGNALVEITLEHSHTCYRGDRDNRHAWGYGCGDCPACELRAAGYEKWKAS